MYLILFTYTTIFLPILKVAQYFVVFFFVVHRYKKYTIHIVRIALTRVKKPLWDSTRVLEIVNNF